MKFLLCPMGSAGDVFPFLGLGKELQARGGEVTVFTTDYFQREVEQLGFQFLRLGPPGVYEQSIKDPSLWHPTRSFPYLYKTMCLPTLDEQFQAVSAFSKKYSASATLVNCFGFGALCAGEALKARVYSIHLQPSVLASLSDPPALPQVKGPRWLRRVLLWLGGKIAIDPVVLPSLNSFRRSKGLPPTKDVMHWWRSPQFNLMFFPSWFAEPAADWPKPFLQSSFPLWERSEHAPIPADVEAFLNSGEPPVALTGGTANVHAKQFFHDASIACKMLGHRVLFLAADPGQLPDFVAEDAYACPFVSLRKLLPRCKAIVNHGGVGTVSQAIASGTPQLIVPLAHDQFDNGERVAKLGVGLVSSRSKPTAGSLQFDLERLLASDQVPKNLSKLQALLVSRNGLSDAADAIVARINNL